MGETLPKTIVAVVVHDGSTISIACMSTLLQLQQQAVLRASMRIETTFVRTAEDAFKRMDEDDFEVMCVISGDVGVSPDFFFAAIASDAPLAIWGVSPLPQMHWDAVAARVKDGTATEEPIEHAGLQYNVTPVGPWDGAARYLSIETPDLKHLSVCAVRRGVTPATAAWTADLECPCNVTGPTEFSGCIGLRKTGIFR